MGKIGGLGGIFIKVEDPNLWLTGTIGTWIFISVGTAT
jgi:hypothetical protein